MNIIRFINLEKKSLDHKVSVFGIVDRLKVTEFQNRIIKIKIYNVFENLSKLFISLWIG